MSRFGVVGIAAAILVLLGSVSSSNSGSHFELNLGSGGHPSHSHHRSWGFEAGGDDAIPFFDHDVEVLRPRGGLRRLRDRRSAQRPRMHEGMLRLRYLDRGYARVLLQSEDRDWQRVEMHRREGDRVWEIEIPPAEDVFRYRFVVEYEDGRERFRVDPSHTGRERVEERGWVSVLRIDRDGTLQWPDSGSWRSEWSEDSYDLDFVRELQVDYQRVDGWLVSTRPRFESRSRWSPMVASTVGYGFKSDRWTTAVYLLQPLSPRRELRAVLAAYDRTDFTDRTGVSGFENLFSTLLFREDNRDHYRRRGASLGLEADWRRRALARVEFRWDDYESLPRIVRAGWGGRDDFLPNLPVDEGRMRSLFVRIRIGDPLRHFFVGYEWSAPAWSSDFDFQQLMLRLRTRMKLGRANHLDFRVQWAGNLAGRLPLQKRYLLGGIGTIRGYRYQSVLQGVQGDPASYGGEQMILATAEYVLGDEGSLQLALFGDTGMAYVDRRAAIDPSEWKSSAGIGVILGDMDGVRLDLIRTLDSDAGDLVLQGRWERAF